MNHQIEDDVDVEAALGEGAEPMHFDETRIRQERPRRVDGGIETLGVANGKPDAVSSRGADHRIGLVERACHWFLDQHRNARGNK